MATINARTSHYGTSENAKVIDASGEKLAFVFIMPFTGTCTKIGFRTLTVTTADTLKVGLETVSTSGEPTGTAYGGSTAGTVASPTSNTTHECTLSVAASCTAGDLVAVVIEFNSYVAGNLQLADSSPTLESYTHFPFVTHYTTAWAKQTGWDAPLLYLYFSDSGGLYKIPPFCVPPMGSSFSSVNSSTTPDEVGVQFTPSVDLTITGYGFRCREFSTTQQMQFKIYDNHATTPTVLVNVPTIAANVTNVLNQLVIMSVPPLSVTAGSTVTLCLFLDDASNSLYFFYGDVSDSAHWGNYAQGCTYCYRTRTTDASPGGGPGFSTTATRLPQFIIVTEISTQAAGGGGGARNPMRGPLS